VSQPKARLERHHIAPNTPRLIPTVAYKARATAGKAPKHYRTPVAFFFFLRSDTRETEHFKRQDLEHAEHHLEPKIGLQAKTTKASSMPPHATARRRIAATEGARPAARPHAGLWAEVGQTSESKVSAGLRRQISIMATS
jgi:hypothetical protein